MSDLGNTVVAIDLDDTLYPEADYRRSGITAVSRRIQALYGRDIEAALQAAGEDGADIWQLACSLLGAPPSAKDQFLWIYRLHEPAIALSADTAETLDWLERACRRIIIITDGRSTSQRAKLRALGLAHHEALISEETGGEKPDPTRFEAIMRAHPGSPCVYFADNPQKDFIAPNRLGWRTVGLRGTARNVHSSDDTRLPPSHRPHVWVDRFCDLRAVL
jgi:putative hydrolase of the HAD superfamily